MIKNKTVAVNAQTLNISLLEIYNGLLDNKVKVVTAKNASSISGNIIRNNFARLQYKKLTKSDAPIDFFEEVNQ